MDQRIGRCSQCGAEYKVPASFAHDVARCKVCQGVVRFGSDGAAAPAAPQGEVVEEIVKPDAARKRAERGTLARLKAERAAQAAGSARTSAGPAEPAEPPLLGADDELFAVEDTGLGEPLAAEPLAPEPAAPEPAAPEPVAGTKPAAAPGRSRPSGRASRGRETSSGSARRRGGRSRRPATKQKKAPVGALLGALAVILVAGGLYFFRDSLLGSDASEGDVAAAETEATDAGAEGPAGTGATEADAAAEPGDEEVAPEPEEAAPQETQVAAEPAPKPPKDPDSIDLTAIEDFGPPLDCSEEEWAQMNEWMATFGDLNAGAAGGRAGRHLEEAGRKAIPVVINHMKTLDLTTEDGLRAGDMLQRTLQRMFHGKNWGWRYAGDEDHVWFDKKVIENWAKTWEKVDDDIEEWIRLVDLDKEDPEEAERLRELYGSAAQEDELGGLDDLGDDLDVD